MMTSRIRWVVIGLSAALALWAVQQQQYQAAALVGLGIGYLIWSYFREGTVFLATQAFQQRDYERTRFLLDDIRAPEKLRKGRRNYYEFMRGNLALQAKDYDAAEVHFQIASRLPFRRPNDKAIVLVHLANINLRKKDGERVRAYLDLAKKLDVTSRTQEIIKKIENETMKAGMV